MLSKPGVIFLSLFLLGVIISGQVCALIVVILVLCVIQWLVHNKLHLHSRQPQNRFEQRPARRFEQKSEQMFEERSYERFNSNMKKARRSERNARPARKKEIMDNRAKGKKQPPLSGKKSYWYNNKESE